jgi:hypothetical protein
MKTTKTRPAPWSAEENKAICSLYFEMLDAAINGHPYSKAAMIRDAQDHEQASTDNDYTGELDTRSKGSIEAKLMNCTAAHRDLRPGAITMDGYGYRALSNYQATLKDAMNTALAGEDVIAMIVNGRKEGAA